MRLLLIPILLVLLTPWPARAAAAPAAPATEERMRKEQVTAATDNAVRALRQSIAQEPITDGLTVEQLLERTKSGDRLLDVLRRAEQIGGPRWVDERTCQVQLEISGARAAQALVQIAASEPKKSPVPASELALRLKGWEQRTFGATGSSTSASDIGQLRPDGEAGGEAWAGVSDDARRDALQAAKDDAVRRALTSVSDVQLPTQKPIADLLNDPAVRKDVERWLANRPVTTVAFRDDRQVEVSLSAAPAEFTGALREALARRGQALDDDAAWAQAGKRLADKLGGPLVGRAGVPEQAGTTTPSTRNAATAVTLPALPPTWTNEQLTADATAAFTESKLKTARAAEADARTKLAQQARALPMDGGTTLGAAVDRDPDLKAALDRALRKAEPYAVDYEPDGRVRVKLSVDLRQVWDVLVQSH